MLVAAPFEGSYLSTATNRASMIDELNEGWCSL